CSIRRPLTPSRSPRDIVNVGGTGFSTNGGTFSATILKVASGVLHCCLLGWSFLRLLVVVTVITW
ncbi:MAG: hypothetical protein SGI71_04640, partial [Verrucomicrobiota bacterium]|nr:hypothetical protein [Verrucomicrobiota bacterium]